ncbi:nitronate monooxygenase [Lysobacter niastensis]|uniref:Propionate 3-nitronate monooxygenase n=1 Tax=Lysobacter niastensis TaxID=380629 RepID=A0ABU1W9J5_9GAMM|nr:nitronate monooxygenase [Lysobacter niastensis]MDR7134306.1 nitronate monooxygenase [Lysobacter niastensis]
MHAGPSSRLLDLLGIQVPIIQAPMAGVSSPAMAAAVSNSGGLGSLGVGAMSATQARDAVRQFGSLSDGPLNVNLFVHAPANADERKQAAWLQRLRPEFDRWGSRTPDTLQEIYRSFLVDDEMLTMLVAERPRVVSFHFGLPRREQVEALRAAGIVLLATATNLAEARMIEDAGLDAIVAQGYEAGGHRGMFDPDAEDSCLGTLALTRILVKSVGLPIIAAGGIMDGAGIAAALALGAGAAQLGTAFVATDESLADAGYRERLAGIAVHHTVMTRVISGRPARGLANDFTRWGMAVPDDAVPDYPIAYDAGKALNAAARSAGQTGYGAQWAGQGAPLVRALSTQALMRALTDELARARSDAN